MGLECFRWPSDEYLAKHPRRAAVRPQRMPANLVSNSARCFARAPRPVAAPQPHSSFARVNWRVPGSPHRVRAESRWQRARDWIGFVRDRPLGAGATTDVTQHGRVQRAIAGCAGSRRNYSGAKSWSDERMAARHAGGRRNQIGAEIGSSRCAIARDTKAQGRSPSLAARRCECNREPHSERAPPRS